MRLTDIMSGANLSIYTEIALVIFLITFAAIVIQAFSRRNRDMFAKVGDIPLSDGNVYVAGEDSER